MGTIVDVRARLPFGPEHSRPPAIPHQDDETRPVTASELESDRFSWAKTLLDRRSFRFGPE